MLDRLILSLVSRPAVRRYIAQMLMEERSIFGPRDRIDIHPTAVIHNALFNTMSGRIVIREQVFFGHNVCLLTGTHNCRHTGPQRRESVPAAGRDIILDYGVWIASNATVIGPAQIGRHAVVAAGSVVTADVAAHTIVAGAPARAIGTVPDEGTPTHDTPSPQTPKPHGCR